MLVATGCAPMSRVTLHQPNAPRSQRRIDLSTDQVFVADRGERRHVVVHLPLPGEADGPPAYHVYLDAPQGRSIVHPTQAGLTRGFLIQTVGDRKGKSALRSGTLHEADVFWSPRTRRFVLDATTDDGTRIVAKLTARIAPSEVASFEQRRAADVALLNPSPSGSEPELSSERVELVEDGAGTPVPEE